MKVKPGVSLVGLKIEMRPVLISADVVWRALGRTEGVTVTAGTDGEHSAGSLHYYGYALDLRTRYWDEQERRTAANMMRRALEDAMPGGYDVVLHSSHMHVEFDPES